MSVDALMVAYGSASRVASSVHRLRAEPKVGRIIVVDHGTDGSGDLARAAGATVVEDPSNPGFGAGVNRAAAGSDATFLLLMNPDAELCPGALEVGLAALAADPAVVAVQGTIRQSTTGAPERSGGRELRAVDLWGRALGARRLLAVRGAAAVVGRIGAVRHQVDRIPTATAEVEQLAATATLVRADAFRRVGGFDERLFLYGEDLDLCRRLRASGGRLLLLPDEWARHENGASSAGWHERELRWWEGTLQFAARWWDDGALRRAKGAALVMAVRLVAHRPSSRRQVWDALVRCPAAVRREVRRGGRGAPRRGLSGAATAC